VNSRAGTSYASLQQLPSKGEAVTLNCGFAVRFVILKVIDRTIGRIAEDQEREGLDTPSTGKVSNMRE